MTVLTKTINGPIVPFSSTLTGSPFSILSVVSIDKRTIVCKCTLSNELFKIHHGCKQFHPKTNDFILVQRKGIGTNFEKAKLMDYSLEKIWQEKMNYSPVISSTEFTFEIHEELAEA